MNLLIATSRNKWASLFNKSFLLAALVFCGTATFAQDDEDDKNLITNPGFESIKGKLKKQKQINIATNWNSPTALGADLFSAEKQNVPVSAPNNYMGREEPYEGSNYAGIITYSYNNKEPRTYIQTELLGPLKKGIHYCVKFNVSLADKSKYSSNNIGAYITQKQFEVEGKTNIIFEDNKDLDKVVLSDKNETYDGRYNWETVCNTFTASGKERFVIIGNFHNTSETAWKKLKRPKGETYQQVPVAYYYIDQVEVFVLDDPSECECAEEKESDITRVIYRKQLTTEGTMSTEQKIKYSTVYFDYLKNNIDPSMVGDLEKLVEVLKENASIQLKLTGNIGPDEKKKSATNDYYRDLGMRRAEAVKKWLVEKGIDASRLTVSDAKANSPATEGSEELKKAQNRRVEFSMQ